jgi:lipoate-protein ligase A
METRLLRSDTPESPSLSVAADEAILDEVARGFSPQTLRFFRCDRSVLLGKSNKVDEVVDVDVARKNGINLARRFFESEASYHDIGVLNFSFIANTSAFGGDLSAALSALIRCTADALREPGVEMNVASSAITIDGNRIFDSRIAATKGALLFNGFVSIDSDIGLHRSVLKTSRFDSSMCAPANMSAISKKSVEEVRRAISGSFASGLGADYVITGFTEDELDNVNRIQWRRYERLL